MFEGVRAILVDKTGDPKWEYQRIEDIPERSSYLTLNKKFLFQYGFFILLKVLNKTEGLSQNIVF
ncbi:3-hydroxyisobutyryl-CoA hydrolase [Fusobacterium necrophorum subsp. necrophorum]|nr:3-hydroxyisobutyryl-CoA hydrolase [Fusobacterium necrophorum subsp. necrophorum]